MKKVVSLALSTLLVLSLAACGKANSSAATAASESRSSASSNSTSDSTPDGVPDGIKVGDTYTTAGQQPRLNRFAGYRRGLRGNP